MAFVQGLHQGYNEVAGASMPAAKLAERCKPDYEAAIKLQQEDIKLIEESLPIILRLHRKIGDTQITLLQLVGVLYASQERSKEVIAELISRQEAEKE